MAAEHTSSFQDELSRIPLADEDGQAAILSDDDTGVKPAARLPPATAGGRDDASCGDSSVNVSSNDAAALDAGLNAGMSAVSLGTQAVLQHETSIESISNHGLDSLGPDCK